MTLNDQKALFSITFAQAVAAAAGFNVNGVPMIDDDSVDLTLCASGHKSMSRRPKLDLQLKCTSSPQFVGDRLAFNLKRKNYEDLSAGTVCPRILVVLTVPPDPMEWMLHTADTVILRTRAYWTKLQARPGLPLEQESVTVHLPHHQRFDCQHLTTMMEEANRG